MHMTTGIGTGTYRVLERNAHAWPEVYFPKYGWIQFEPTASEPLLARPVEQTITPTPTGPSEEIMGTQMTTKIFCRIGAIRAPVDR